MYQILAKNPEICDLIRPFYADILLMKRKLSPSKKKTWLTIVVKLGWMDIDLFTIGA